MRYTCLDVRSPDVNFLRKVMSSSRHDGAAYSRHPCRQSADADIVSAFPLPFSTFLENINILRQTSSTWHRIRREFCVLESLKKTVAPAGYKNKQCRKQTSVLSGRTVTAYVPLRSATERERAAFLIPCQGLRGFDSISLLTFHLSYSFLSLHKLIRIIRYDQRLSGADAVLFRQMVDALYLIYIFLLILILFIINIILGQIP